MFADCIACYTISFHSLRIHAYYVGVDRVQLAFGFLALVVGVLAVIVKVYGLPGKISYKHNNIIPVSIIMYSSYNNIAESACEYYSCMQLNQS